MKKFFKKHIFVFLVVVVYSSQVVTQENSYKAYIYFLVNIAAAAFLYMIKNKYIALICSLLPLVVMEFIEPECKFFSLIPILLICAHKNIISEMVESEKHKEKSERLFSVLLSQSCLFLSVAFIIYDLVLSIENNNTYIPYYVKRSLFILVWLLIVFVFSLIDSHNNKNEKKARKHFLGKIRFLYFISVLGLFATVLYCCVEHNAVSFAQMVMFFPWLLFICSLLYNEDPYVEAMSEKLRSR